MAEARIPTQDRGKLRVEALLDAAEAVLAEKGYDAATMTEIAERAGASIGSLYQYFPTKAYILFRLQSDEWRQTANVLSSILENSQRPPLERLRILVQAFIRSECDEAEVRVALGDAAPLYRDAPEAREAREGADLTFRCFMREVLPGAS